ncbi:MAG: hypothetical protein RLY86_863 [Pseudomonadota bacterium]
MGVMSHARRPAFAFSIQPASASSASPFETAGQVMPNISASRAVDGHANRSALAC